MEEKRKPRPWVTWLAVGLLVLLVAYPLSTGPMMFLAIKGYIPEWFGELPIYYPLQLLCDRVPPIARMYVWYDNWWMGR